MKKVPHALPSTSRGYVASPTCWYSFLPYLGRRSADTSEAENLLIELGALNPCFADDAILTFCMHVERVHTVGRPLDHKHFRKSASLSPSPILEPGQLLLHLKLGPTPSYCNAIVRKTLRNGIGSRVHNSSGPSLFLSVIGREFGNLLLQASRLLYKVGIVLPQLKYPKRIFKRCLEV